MSARNFDVIIIGSGQAGIPLAHKMASEGKKVALIERANLGGTCVNTGCTPTKSYVASARCAWVSKTAADLGISVPEHIISLMDKIKQRKDDIVKDSRESLLSGINENSNIDLFMAEASFTGFKTLIVNQQKLFAHQIFINTGGSPVIPDEFKNIPYLTNETILELDQLPEHLIVVGGNYLGLEFAQMFRRFGSQVTVIEKAERLMPKEDPEVSHEMKDILEQEGIKFILSAECIETSRVAPNQLSLLVNCNGNESAVSGTHVLLAVGRKPNTGALNLQATNLETNQSGYIEVNEKLETKVSGIYALGDCNGRGAFTHTSYNDYLIIKDNLLEDKSRDVSDRIPVYCIYTDPPLARAGLNRTQALEKGYNILQAKLPMSNVARAIEKAETKGFMSAIIDADSHKILGVTLLGTSADEVISSFLILMHTGVPYNMADRIMFPHPTVSELIPTMLTTAKRKMVEVH
jgi:pyruvate/2-oxoglutarate dehydrogenase complex dihydrolipoamide dehydrogenase (E3) component